MQGQGELDAEMKRRWRDYIPKASDENFNKITSSEMITLQMFTKVEAYLTAK